MPRTLDPLTEKAARDFLSAISKDFAVAGGVIYGSRARGDFNADSDADLLVMLERKPGATIDVMLGMLDAAYQIELDSGIVISPLPISRDEWEHPDRFSNPGLLANIRRDGITI